MTMASQPSLRLLTTPRAAALAGVLFALLFGAVLILIRRSWLTYPRMPDAPLKPWPSRTRDIPSRHAPSTLRT